MKLILSVLVLAFLCAPTAHAFGPKKPEAEKLCGDYEGTLKIPEIPLKIAGPGGQPVTPPAYASVWVYDGDHSTLSVPDDVPLILPFAYGKYKQVPVPVRLNAAGDGYLVGPMDLELKKKLAGFAGTSGTCRQYIWRMVLTLNPSPWSCTVKACPGRDNPNPDFFLGPNGPAPYKGVPPVAPSGLENFRPDLAVGTEVELMHDAYTYGSSYAEYLKKTTKLVANARAMLDELSSKGVSKEIKASDKLEGKALWSELQLDFVAGIELPEDQGFYSFYTRQTTGDLYFKCARIAAQANRPMTAYGFTDRKWPGYSPSGGFEPGTFYLSGLDADTWAFCQDRLKPGEPYWDGLAAQAPGVVAFGNPKYSHAQGADVRRPNINGTYPLKLMTSPLEQDPARGVGAQTDQGWEPIVAGFSKEDLDCLIEKAKDGRSAEFSAYRSVDRASGVQYLRLARLESLCFRRRP